MSEAPKKEFQGKAIPADAGSFQRLPQGIGQLLMGELDPHREAAVKKAKNAWLWIALGAFIGFWVGFLPVLLVGFETIMAFIMGAIVGVAGLGLGYRYTRSELRERFVGENGMAEFVYLYGAKNKGRERKFVFQSGLHLYTSSSTEDKKHLGDVTEFNVRWRDGKSNAFQVIDKYIKAHATAGTEAGHPWAKAGEKAWTNWLKAQTPAWKEAGKGIQFVVLGGTLIYLFPDRVKIENVAEGTTDEFKPDVIKRIQLPPDLIRWVKSDGNLEFALEKFSDRKYFFWLVKEWYGWEAVKVKK